MAHSLTNERAYVHQTIEYIKLTRSLLNSEYDINEIDDECQAIDDEWIEFMSDFDDQKQEINKTENICKKFDSEINRTHQWLKEQENSFQLMTTNQSTLELKLEKLEQIKVGAKKQNDFFFYLLFFLKKILIRNLGSQIDLGQELKQLETKVSITPLIQNFNQCIDKRQQLLSNAEVRFNLRL